MSSLVKSLVRSGPCDEPLCAVLALEPAALLDGFPTWRGPKLTVFSPHSFCMSELQADPACPPSWPAHFGEAVGTGPHSGDFSSQLKTLPRLLPPFDKTPSPPTHACTLSSPSRPRVNCASQPWRFQTSFSLTFTLPPVCCFLHCPANVSNF